MFYQAEPDKFEILISKLETNPYDRNPNDQNVQFSSFDIVSDFGFGAPNFQTYMQMRWDPILRSGAKREPEYERTDPSTKD